jgi:hypothetical protein
MRTVIRIAGLGLSIALTVAGWRLGSAGADAGVMIRPHVEVTHATREQLELVRWAVGRFEAAGLRAPSVRIAFHDEPDGCREHLGFARGDRVDVCTALVNAMTRRALLHEMGHVWLDQHSTPSIRAGFLALRRLPSWSSPSDPWQLRGFEQGAEIIAWALGERILTAQIPDNRPGALGVAFELLTGVVPPTP